MHIHTFIHAYLFQQAERSVVKMQLNSLIYSSVLSVHL